MAQIRSNKQRSVNSEQIEISDELAWRVHENAKSWITQVDVKSAAALAIEAAVLGFAFSLVTSSNLLINLSLLSKLIVCIGLIILLSSVVLSILVLLPRIKLGEPKPKERGYLYFGHLRHWDKDILSATLARNHVSDGEIASQVIKMSQIAWRKHVLLQWSLFLLLAGIVVIGGLYLCLILDLYPGILGNISNTTSTTGAATCL